MIGDRHYMREPSFRSERPLSIKLIIVLVICFVVQTVLMYYANASDFIFDWLALNRYAITRGRIWQLVTFQFLHGGLLHLFFNCLVLYMFGLAVENTMSRKHFLTLYFGSGIAGGLLEIVGHLLLPNHFGGAVVGASAGLMGLLAAFAFMFPHQQILVFFILPVPAMFFFIFSVLLSLYCILVPSVAGGIAHGAHLGGLLAGWFYIKFVIHGGWEMPTFRIKMPSMKKESERPTPQQMAAMKAARQSSQGDLPPEEFISKEVDPILDKISAHGIQSLTDRERRILEAARARMARR
jgi:membrane associated rhomboid family serine protease